MLRVMVMGKFGVGKDTLASCIRQVVPDVTLASFATPVKEQVAEMLNYTIRKFDIKRPKVDPNDRALLGTLWQWYGTEFVRAVDPTYWVRQFDQQYGHVERIVVPDCRFLNEAIYGRAHGFALVRIRGDSRRSHDLRSPEHLSEQSSIDLPVDLEYWNDGTIDEMRQWVVATLIPFAVAAGKRFNAHKMEPPTVSVG